MYIERECGVCGTRFTPQKRCDQKYCSHKCGKRAFDIKKATNKKEQAKSNPPLCQQCQKPFLSFYYSGTKTKFCSINCKDEWHKARKRVSNRKRLADQPNTCQFCKREFLAYRLDQQFCSNRCKADFHLEIMRQETEKIRSQTIKTCPMCNKPFSPKKTLKEMYCSPYCRRTIGRRIYAMLDHLRKQTNTKKVNHAHKVLGYSKDDLMTHLQNHPNWEMVKDKVWHIDHIFPIIAFIRRGITDPKIICCLENLQPLNGKENCSKNDSYDETAFDNWLHEQLILGQKCIFLHFAV